MSPRDSNADGDYIDSFDFTHYALTDHQFSVVALIDSAANLIERVSYTPYGEARHHWMQDVDGDGDIDATDQSWTTAALNNRIYQANYNVDADFNRDGLIDSSDSRQIGSGSFRGALPAGWISSLSTGNSVGFSGYMFNAEVDAGGLYSVRFRHYDPVWGRWISRDPAGYRDSKSLYGYGFGSPLWGTDAMGLWWGSDAWDWFKHRIIEGNNPVHEWIADNIVTPILGEDVLVNTHPAVLYGGGVVVAVGLGLVIWYALPAATVGVGPGIGAPFHVVFGAKGAIVGATGRFFAMRIATEEVRFLALMGFRFFRVPVLFASRVTCARGAAFCFTAAWHGLMRGWFYHEAIGYGIIGWLLYHLFLAEADESPQPAAAPAPTGSPSSTSPGVEGHNGHGNNSSGQSTCGGPQASHQQRDIELQLQLLLSRFRVTPQWAL